MVLILASLLLLGAADARAGALETLDAAAAGRFAGLRGASAEVRAPEGAPLAAPEPPDRAADFPEVVPIEVGGSLCTATWIGPRALVTAAHCGFLLQGDVARIRFAGMVLWARVRRSPGYRGVGTHDVALLTLDRDVPGVRPASLGAMSVLHAMVTIAGYGEDMADQDRPPRLHAGTSAISLFLSGPRIQLEEMSGDVARLGDSGGPVFLERGGRRLLLGVISTGNRRSWTRAIRLDDPLTLQFLRGAAAEAGVSVCGLGTDCGAPG